MGSKRKILYIDLDDTLADFYELAKDDKLMVEESKMYSPEFFFRLAPIPGSREAIFALEKMGFDIWILTQPLADCYESYTDKAKWVGRYFPKLINKIIMTQDKGLNLGEYLVDDNKEKWAEKFESNGGKFIHFPYTRNDPDQNKNHWSKIVEFFNNEEAVYLTRK